MWLESIRRLLLPAGNPCSNPPKPCSNPSTKREGYGLDSPGKNSCEARWRVEQGHGCRHGCRTIMENPGRVPRPACPLHPHQKPMQSNGNWKESMFDQHVSAIGRNHGVCGPSQRSWKHLFLWIMWWPLNLCRLIKISSCENGPFFILRFSL